MGAVSLSNARAAKTQGPRSGMDVAGRATAVGQNVTRFQPDAAVFGWSDGSYAEYPCAGEDHFATNRPTSASSRLRPSPSSGSPPPGSSDEGEVQAGQKVLIIGAAGGVGSFGVQLAKAFGAHVTGGGQTAAAAVAAGEQAGKLAFHGRPGGDRWRVGGHGWPSCVSCGLRV
jgi:NADPH:quinone reductase-like Zn-dependent oxidoreductase